MRFVGTVGCHSCIDVVSEFALNLIVRRNSASILNSQSDPNDIHSSMNTQLLLPVHKPPELPISRLPTSQSSGLFSRIQGRSPSRSRPFPPARHLPPRLRGALTRDHGHVTKGLFDNPIPIIYSGICCPYNEKNVHLNLFTTFFPALSSAPPAKR